MSTTKLQNRQTSIVLTDLTQTEIAYLVEYFGKTQSEIIRDAVREYARQAKHEEAKRAAELDRIRQAV